MFVREAIRSDAPALSSLMTNLGYPTSVEDLLQRMEKFPTATHRTFVAGINGEVAGFVGCSAQCIYESDQPICWIMTLSVMERFQRLGIGRILLAEVERWCAKNRFADMRLNSGIWRSEAHLFYEACGFERVGYRFKKSVKTDIDNYP